MVDSRQRRQDVAAAVWRVVVREGLERASVRNVAREAGLSMGSLRHYFATQSELLAFTLQTVIERVERRMAAHESEPNPRRRAELVLAEVLPLDPERAAENRVWLAFTARAMVDPQLRALQDDAYDLLRAGCANLLREMGVAVEVIERETDRLHALIDGLAVHAAMRPAISTRERMREILAAHLDTLAC